MTVLNKLQVEVVGGTLKPKASICLWCKEEDDRISPFICVRLQQDPEADEEQFNLGFDFFNFRALQKVTINFGSLREAFKGHTPVPGAMESSPFSEKPFGAALAHFLSRSAQVKITLSVVKGIYAHALLALRTPHIILNSLPWEAEDAFSHEFTFLGTFFIFDPKK